MWYIIIAGFLIIGVFFSSRFTSCNTPAQSENSDTKITVDSPYSENDTIKAMFSKQQIDKKLKRLAEIPPPEKLSFGAMCYKVAFENVTVYEYVCPECGEKTVYKKDKNPDKSWFIQNMEKNINSCRREIEKVKGINIKLDESQFCKYCRPVGEDPQMCLLVSIAGQSGTNKVCNISYKDIQIIGEFLNDKLVHSGERNEETPLVNDLVRIKELLGLK